MTTFQAAPRKHIAREGGHDDGQKKCTQDKERFYQIYQIPDPTVRNQVNVPKKVIAPAHAKREYQATVDMLETVGCVTKQIENNGHILHGRKSGNFRF
jgi:hypothetical protein